MKLINLFLFLISLCLFSCNTEPTDGFELKGKLSNAHGDTLFLEQMSPTGIIGIDTTTVNENGEFSLHPSIKEIGFYRLKSSNRNYATFIFDANQKVSITGDITDLNNTYSVEGSEDSKLFWEINKASSDNYKQRDSLQKTFQDFVNISKMDSLRIDSMSNALEKPYTDLVNAQNQYLISFIEKHPTSFASLAAIQQLPPGEFIDIYFKLDNSLYEKYPNSVYVKSFHESVAASRKIDVGTVAPEINLNSPEGKPLALSSLRGKIVLLDFWASWCGPCRAENPNVVSAYNKYNTKGFDIYSVSLDEDLNKWGKAIKTDGLIWKNHVCDFKSWRSPVAALYNITSIPTNVLIDQEGKIIAKDLRGEALEMKLKELFK